MDNINPLRIKQLGWYVGFHYALIESPQCDYLWRLFSGESWVLPVRMTRLQTWGTTLILLPGAAFCRSLWIFDGNQISSKELSDGAFFLSDGFLVKRSIADSNFYEIFYESDGGIVDLIQKKSSGRKLPIYVNPIDIVMACHGVLLLSHAMGFRENKLHALLPIDRDAWQQVCLPTPDYCTNTILKWSGDSQVLVSSDFRDQYQKLFHWNLESNSLDPLDSSPRDQYLYKDSNVCISNHRGYCEIVTSFGQFQTGFCENLSVGPDQIVLQADQPGTNQRIWSLNIGKVQKQVTQNLSHEPQSFQLDELNHLIPSKELSMKWTVESLDSRQLIRFRPLHIPRASILFIHGGPSLCEGYRMREFHTELIGNGFEVISFDGTGSGGFGRDFRNRLDRSHGNLDLRELAELIDLKIKVQPVFLWGESYGGYLALKAALEYQSRIAGVINFYGVTDWLEAMLKMQYLPQPITNRVFQTFHDPNLCEGRKYLKNISILPRAEELKLPILTVHGKLDKSVPLKQSQSLHKAMIHAHQLSQLLILENEGHEVRFYENRMIVISEVIAFLNECLKL